MGFFGRQWNRAIRPVIFNGLLTTLVLKEWLRMGAGGGVAPLFRMHPSGATRLLGIASAEPRKSDECNHDGYVHQPHTRAMDDSVAGSLGITDCTFAEHH
jgi:hypothetical protein